MNLKIKVIVLLSWLSLVEAFSQDVESLQKIFYSLKTMNFQNVSSEHQKIKDRKTRSLVTALINMILNEKKIGAKFHVKDKDSEENKFLKYYLNGHYYSLKNGYGSVEGFESFIEAIKHAETLGSAPLKKAALIGVLDLLKYQVFIGSNQYEQYLQEYRALKSDDIDQILLVLYEIVFYSKADENLKHREKDYQAALREMDSVFSGLSETHRYMPFYLHEKGVEYKFAFEPELAASYFLRVAELTEGKQVYRRLYGTNYWQLSDMFINSGKFGQAYEYLEKSRSVASSLKDTFYDNRLAARYYSKIGEYKKAHAHLKESMENEYILSSKNYSFMSNQLSTQFEEEAKVKFETLEKEKQILEEQQKTRANRNWLIAATLALLLGTGIAILLQKNTTKKRLLAEQEAILKQQRVENLLKEQELVSIDAMIAGQEKERQKVAGELHDDLGSLMATIKLHFDNAKVSKQDPALQNAQKLLEEAYQKIRGMAHNKHSGVMSDQGLLPALKKMAKTITDTDALKVTVEDFGLGERMENSLELSIFRMIQELVANVIKHAEASHVTIQLTQHEDNLNIIVEDNGKGFDRSQIKTGDSGMGLTTIEKRIEHLEGNFTIDSVLGRGSSILIDIPV